MHEVGVIPRQIQLKYCRKAHAGSNILTQQAMGVSLVGTDPRSEKNAVVARSLLCHT